MRAIDQAEQDVSALRECRVDGAEPEPRPGPGSGSLSDRNTRAFASVPLNFFKAATAACWLPALPLVARRFRIS